MLFLERHTLRSETLLLSSELAPIPREPVAPGDSPSAAPACGRFEILGDTSLLFFRSRGELYLRADPLLLRVTPEVVSSRVSFGAVSQLRFHLAGRFILRISYPTPGDFPDGTISEEADFARFVDAVLQAPERRATIWRDVSGGAEASAEGPIARPLVLVKNRGYKEILLLGSELAEPVLTERVSGDDPSFRETAGKFAPLGGDLVLLFRSHGNLYLRVDPVLLRVTPEVHADQWAWGEASRLSVRLADRFLLEVPYETPDFLRSPVGILPFFEKETLDFGMAVEQIFKNRRAREKAWTGEGW